LNETIKQRSMRFWSVFTATALGITCSNGWLATNPYSGALAYGQLMAPPTVAPPPASPSPAISQPPANPLRDQALSLTTQAKLALGRGDVVQAKSFIEKANALRVPDSDFVSGQTRPWQVAMEIDRAERQRASSPLFTPPALGTANTAQPIPNLASANPGFVPPSGMPAAPGTTSVVPASATVPVHPNPTQNQNAVGPSVFLPKQDKTQVKPAAALLQAGEATKKSGTGEELYRTGVAALSAGDRDQAIKLFNEAWKHEREMDALTRAQLKDKLMLLQGNKNQSKPSGAEPVTAMQQLSEEQNLARQKMWREVTTEIAEAEKMVVDGNPNAALDRLQMLRQRVSQSSVDGTIRKSNLAMVDRVITNIQAYIEQNRPAIEQEETNRRIEDRMAMEAATRAKIDGEVQSMVDQYNDLMEKGMYSEAEIVAKKVGQLDPNSEITTVLISKATIAKRIQEQQEIKALKNERTTDALISVDEASTPFNDRVPYMMPDAKIWDETSKLRSKFGEKGFTLTPAEKAIREKLVEPVDVAFDGRQLTQVMQSLSEMTGIPIYIDPLGLAAEGLTSDHRITLNLNGQSVSLKSALNLMLEPINMTYVIKDEVLKITSKNTTNKVRHTIAHPVRDLVTPIPNFVSDYNSGLAGALQSAYQANNSMLLVKSNEMTGLRLGSEMLAGNSPSASLSPDLKALGQMGGMPGMPGMPGMMGGGGPPAMGSSSPFMMGNGGNGFGGGGSLANFTELINLIQTTVESSWEADGGEDSIREFPSNLSLIVSAPLETHEAITDLLKQLRALQNLQVTIEVRFITLNDTFFEQMGVDFDFNIADKKLFDGDGLLRRNEGSTTVGVSGPGAPVPNRLNPTLDVQFQNGSFSASAPPFGAPGVGDASSIGFAILSDLELFFFLQAVQGDSRTNVMQAPKVTMFDGQVANIIDQAQRPFVMGLQPVVGDFAVAQQPIIVILNDGTSLNVQSVVSQDKRYVRMTLAPSFTRIEDADRQFTFTGTRTSRTGTSVIGPDGKPTTDRNNEEEVVSGSTVQLPTLGTTTVSTTVNVPDGGTILLGGIKRLQEGRNERGVPILSKIPYINRLFKNVGIGRTTNTLMMTVTPRIIIPEEEEAKVTGVGIAP
jgi:general secretion pathway protein D